MYLWRETGFGALDPLVVLRVVIPTTTVLAIGVQTLLMSFLFSMFGLARRA